MLEESARKLAAAWCDAWNRRDLDAIMEHYADDVEFSSPTVVKRWGISDGWLRGSSKVRENFAIGGESAWPSLRACGCAARRNSMCVVYRRESGALVTDSRRTRCQWKGPACDCLLWFAQASRLTALGQNQSRITPCPSPLLPQEQKSLRSLPSRCGTCSCVARPPNVGEHRKGFAPQRRQSTHSSAPVCTEN